MDLDAATLYPLKGPYELVIFDVRGPGIAVSVHELLGAWGSDSHLEMLDLNHAVLIIKPGGALEIAA